MLGGAEKLGLPELIDPTPSRHRDLVAAMLAATVIAPGSKLASSARIRDELRPAQLDWISALRADQIRVLVNDGALQLSLVDEQNLLEITHPDYPGERLVCCHNPALADAHARKRDELLAATERQLQAVAAATRRARQPLRGTDKIALRGARCATSSKWPNTSGYAPTCSYACCPTTSAGT